MAQSFKLPDPRPLITLIFMGHVDAGKSTTCGYILVETGQVDQRSLEKYEKEAIENNRSSWYYAYIMDINEEEREKGKTTEVGQAKFDIGDRRFAILDAPGHKSFVPEMVGGAAQADVGILIVSARRGEFEAGFENGGQTQEHALLAKTLGVNSLIVAVNKMDEPSVAWSEERYEAIVQKLTSFLRSNGYNVKTDVFFLPITGLSGDNIKLNPGVKSNPNYSPAAEWCKDKPTLFELLSSLPLPARNPSAPLRVTLSGGYRGGSLMLVGKVVAGTVVSGQSALLMPGNVPVKVNAVVIDGEEFTHGKPGEHVELKVSGADDSRVSRGQVLCGLEHPVPVSDRVVVQFFLVDALEHKPLFTAGYRAIFHIHTAVVECEIELLLETLSKASKAVTKKPKFAKVGMIVKAVLRLDAPQPLEPFVETPILGRFTIRDEAKTVAIGKITKVLA
uniref:Eukaryotic peptide chain release factor GTP-binding subunit-like n=1 Tax=Dermatophagoides pteronyssinus TaxID=6956 RepID=A0A6P6Y784_DERPT|nr:eukaryotic peptide chain release factor GTP-binding subunit-like [Dermatophagoides pteronyssinus]